MSQAKATFWSVLQSQATVNPRLLRLMSLILFDAIVIGELLLWNALTTHSMIVALEMNDFGKFYYSALAHLNGQTMYGPNPATWIHVGPSQAMHFWNLNPPHFHIPLLPLALMQPVAAIALWGAASFACLVYSSFLIIKEAKLDLRGPWRRRLAIAGMLLFAGTGATLITGQLSFILLLIVTKLWLHARHGEWNKAGLLLGISISIKPFLLIILPYFLLRRQFRAIGICLLVILASFGAGLLVFGVDNHLSWLRVLSASSGWTWASMNASISGFLNRTFSASPVFSPVVSAPNLIRIVWFPAAGFIFFLTAAAIIRRGKDFSLDRDIALLLVAALLISPLGWIYYHWLLLGPMIVLAGAWWRERAQSRWTGRRGSFRWRDGFLVGSLVALAVPLFVVELFEPSRLATVLFGSVYFWGTLALWLSLILDWTYGKGDPPLWSV